jgi:hypothetical protein
VTEWTLLQFWINSEGIGTNKKSSTILCYNRSWAKFSLNSRTTFYRNSRRIFSTEKTLQV